MNTDLRKRLEEAAKDYADENYEVDYSAGTTPYMVGLDEGMHYGAEDGFLAGAEWSYKEAIIDMVQYLRKDYAYNASMAVHDEAFIADFETFMNKLLEEKEKC